MRRNRPTCAAATHPGLRRAGMPSDVKSPVEGLYPTTLIPMYFGASIQVAPRFAKVRHEFHPDPLVAGGLPAHFLQEFPHRIELGAETFPISGFQSLDCPIVAIESLLRPTCRGPTCDGCFL